MILPHLSLDGTCASAVLDIGVAGARGHGQAKKRSEAFQMLSRERLGEQVGRTVLAFRVGHRDLSAFCHVVHEEDWFRCVSSFGVLVRESNGGRLGCLCELQLALRGQALPENAWRIRFRRSQIRLRRVQPRWNSTPGSPGSEPKR